MPASVPTSSRIINGAGPAGRQRPDEHRTNGVEGTGNSTFRQRPHHVLDHHQLAAKAPAGVTGGEVLGGKLPQAAGDEGQRVAEGEHQRRARARREPEGAGLAEGARRHDHDSGAAQCAVGPAGERHDAHAAGGEVRQQSRDLLRLARLRKREHDVVGPQRAEVAMQRLGGMEEVARGAGGGERGGDLPRHEPRLTDPGHHHAAGAAEEHLHAAAEGGVEGVGRPEHRRALGAEDVTAVRENAIIVEIVHAYTTGGESARSPRAGAGW